MNRQIYLFLLLFLLLLTSCASSMKISRYDFENKDVPEAFDSCRVAFISDTHYKSLFKEKQLNKLVKKLKELKPDLLLRGGDYQEGCEYVAPLCKALGSIKPPLGTYGVLGNNDYERCYEEILTKMKENDIVILEHKNDTIRKDGEFIIVSGIRNPFDLRRNGISPTLELSENDFVIMLVHTPDYAEDVSIGYTDLVLAGHTHGGQVRVLGYAPLIPSKYGKRFLKGKMFNSQGMPMIVTNGLGTSRRKIRIGAKAEIVLITLLTPQLKL